MNRAKYLQTAQTLRMIAEVTRTLPLVDFLASLEAVDEPLAPIARTLVALTNTAKAKP